MNSRLSTLLRILDILDDKDSNTRDLCNSSNIIIFRIKGYAFVRSKKRKNKNFGIGNELRIIII